MARMFRTLLAMSAGRFATDLGRDRDLAFYPVVTIVIDSA
jgi:hypothetical protein